MSHLTEARVQREPDCRPSWFYLSFAFPQHGQRERVVNALQRQGVFLVWAWNTVPAFYRVFADTFPYGSGESVFLADRIYHVPLDLYR